ncbi:MAG: glycine cleavage system protein GcvH [Rhodocyclaceae bacterium]|nr:glycine cleavage system protein GcvH [Rhodocyclaceae bacterium]
MMNLPSHLKYAPSHEWLNQEADGTVTIGITDHAQDALGDIVFLELPKVGQKLAKGEACAVIESVKAASDIYAPLSGEVIEIHQSAIDSPEAINKDAFGTWLFKLKPANPSEIEQLLDATDYMKIAGAA